MIAEYSLESVVRRYEQTYEEALRLASVPTHSTTVKKRD
jgi:hypothetical protein